MKESNGFIVGLFALSMIPDNEKQVFEHISKYSTKDMREDYAYYKLNKTVIPENMLQQFEVFLSNTKSLIKHLEANYDQE